MTVDQDLQRTMRHALGSLVMPHSNSSTEILSLLSQHQLESVPIVRTPDNNLTTIDYLSSLNSQYECPNNLSFDQILSFVGTKMDMLKNADQLQNAQSLETSQLASDSRLVNQKSTVSQGSESQETTSETDKEKLTIKLKVPANHQKNQEIDDCVRGIEEQVDLLSQFDLEAIKDDDQVNIQKSISTANYYMKKLFGAGSLANSIITKHSTEPLRDLSLFAQQLLSFKHIRTLKTLFTQNPNTTSDHSIEITALEATLNDGSLFLELIMTIFNCGILQTLFVDDQRGKILNQDMLEICVSSLKDILSNDLIFLFEEEAKTSASKTSEFMKFSKEQSIRRGLTKLSSLFAQNLHLFKIFMDMETIHEEIIISAIYLCMSSFQFNLSSSRLYDDMHFRIIQDYGSAILERIFQNELQHQYFILEEITGLMIRYMDGNAGRNMHRLHSGKTIHPLAALLFSLFQSLVLNKKAINEIISAHLEIIEKQNELDQLDVQYEKINSSVKNVWDNLINKINYFAKTFLARCFPKDQEKSKNSDATHKNVFECLMMDSIAPLFEKDWPVMEFVVLTFSRMMFQLLDEDKKLSDSFLKNIAITWTGELYKQIHNVELEVKNSEWFPHLCEVASDNFRNSYELKYQSVHFHALDSLSFLEKESAKQFFILNFLNKESLFKNPSHLANKFIQGHMQRLENKKKSQIILNSDQKTLSDAYLKYFYSKQPVAQLKEAATTRIIKLVNAEMVQLRSKALRIVQEISVLDSGFLKNPSIFQMVLMRLTDSSSNVRDATVDLISKLFFQRSILDTDVLQKFYHLVSERIMDVGTNVRKRTVRLLRDIYLILFEQGLSEEPNYDILSDCITRIMGRINDEEDSVKELSIKSLHQILFHSFKSVNIAAQPEKHDQGSYVEFLSSNICQWRTMNISQQKEILLIAESIALSCKANKYTAELFGEFLLSYFVFETDTKTGVSDLQRTQMVDSCYHFVSYYMEILIDEDRAIDENLKVGILSALYQISRACPNLLAHHIPTLFLHIQSSTSVSSPEKQVQESNVTEDKLIKARQDYITQFIIQVIKNSISFMKNPDLKLISRLETELMIFINRGSQSCLVASIPCLCHIIQHISFNYSKLIKIITSCIELLLKAKQLLVSQSPLPRNLLPMCLRTLMIVGHIMRYFSFGNNQDKISDNSLTNLFIDQRPQSLDFHILSLLFEFCKSSNQSVSAVALSSIGQALIHHTKFILEEKVQTYFQQVSKSGTSAMKIELIKCLLEFVTAHDVQGVKGKQSQTESGIVSLDSPKKKNRDALLDVKILIGNSEELSDAGISSALMQMHLPFLLECVFDVHNSQMFQFAFKLLQVILDQGLVHPILCVPHLVALETHVDFKTRSKAIHIHSRLYEKHASFMNSKNIECIETTYKYQQLQSSDNIVKGYREDTIPLDDGRSIQIFVALLSPMYLLIQTSKRQKRNEFLTACVSIFEGRPNTSDSQNEINKKRDANFYLFIAENLASLPYKTIDEILIVITRINQLISVESSSWNDKKKDENNQEFLSKLAILCALKMYLQSTYGIPDSKCQNYQPHTNKSFEKPLPQKSIVPTPFLLSNYGIDLDSLDAPNVQKLVDEQVESLMTMSEDNQDYEIGEEGTSLSLMMTASTNHIAVTPTRRQNKRKSQHSQSKNLRDQVESNEEESQGDTEEEEYQVKRTPSKKQKKK